MRYIQGVFKKTGPKAKTQYCYIKTENYFKQTITKFEPENLKLLGELVIFDKETNNIAAVVQKLHIPDIDPDTINYSEMQYPYTDGNSIFWDYLITVYTYDDFDQTETHIPLSTINKVKEQIDERINSQRW